MSAVGGGKPAFYWDTGYPGTEVPPGTKDPDFTQWGMVSMSKDGLQAGRMQQWNAGLEFEVAQGLRGGRRLPGQQGHAASTAAT